MKLVEALQKLELAMVVTARLSGPEAPITNIAYRIFILRRTWDIYSAAYEADQKKQREHDDDDGCIDKFFSKTRPQIQLVSITTNELKKGINQLTSDQLAQLFKILYIDIHSKFSLGESYLNQALNEKKNFQKFNHYFMRANLEFHIIGLALYWIQHGDWNQGLTLECNQDIFRCEKALDELEANYYNENLQLTEKDLRTAWCKFRKARHALSEESSQFWNLLVGLDMTQKSIDCVWVVFKDLKKTFNELKIQNNDTEKTINKLFHKVRKNMRLMKSGKNLDRRHRFLKRAEFYLAILSVMLKEF